MWSQYLWIVVTGAMTSFGMSWAIGANDVANAFGTSVGAKTITLLQACLIAGVMEFAGALSLGGEVTKMIAESIAKRSAFESDPEIFAYGMLCSLVSAFLWVTGATYGAFPVSTTHSIIGSIIGFGLAWRGSSAIVWSESTDEFPYVKGVIPIIISWFSSPLISGILAALMFVVNRALILRRQNSVKYAYYALPPLVVITIFVNVFFVLYKGAKNELKWEVEKSAYISAIIAGGCGFLSLVIGVPFLKWKLEKSMFNDFITLNYPSGIPRDSRMQHTYGNATQHNINSIENNQQPTISIAPYSDEHKDINTQPGPGVFKKMVGGLMHGVSQDVHKEIPLAVQEIHNNAEVFSYDAEQVYSYLQVFSACCVSFAHGANDVANAIGPFAAIWAVYNTSTVTNSFPTPKWILALGGSGIVIGLATYGYNVIRSLGVQLCMITPSRGYCAELATALTVSFASVLGIPVSTTQCIVGAEVGVGVLDGVTTGINWRLFFKTFVMWILTLIVSGLFSAALFAQGVYAPSLIMSDSLHDYEEGIKEVVFICSNQSQSTNITFLDYFKKGNLDPNDLLTALKSNCL